MLGFDFLNTQLMLLLLQHFKSDPFLKLQCLTCLISMLIRSNPLNHNLIVTKLELSSNNFVYPPFLKLLEHFDLVVCVMFDVPL